MVLEDAVERVRPAGLVRTFVDFGPPMLELLTKLARRKQSADPFIERLTDAFPQTAPRTVGTLPHGTGQDLVLELVEPLTWRELDILELIAHRLSNKEIGAKLTISPLTVKRHSINIYQKLQVGGRREAVEKATDLGLLGPS
jgi:LuxR family transcriptional regulator, maltose regulon positive regulatory protein